ncbi:MAG: hypothetical protein K2L81_01795, partial [Muribaculaceae bacterium]|nr:hypothetical protein [Muribaculaceae bacterium]
AFGTPILGVGGIPTLAAHRVGFGTTSLLRSFDKSACGVISDFKVEDGRLGEPPFVDSPWWKS